MCSPALSFKRRKLRQAVSRARKRESAFVTGGIANQHGPQGVGRLGRLSKPFLTFRFAGNSGSRARFHPQPASAVLVIQKKPCIVLVRETSHRFDTVLHLRDLVMQHGLLCLG